MSNALSALSLLLCTLTAIMWPLSYHTPFSRALKVRPAEYLEFAISDGKISFTGDHYLVDWPIAASRPYRE